MTCHQLEDAVGEYGRGVHPGAGTTAAVESHVEHCAACAARIQRDRELTRGLKALVEASARDGARPELEARLLEAFAAHHSSDVARRGEWTRSGWLARAAAVVLLSGASAAGLWLWITANEPTARENTAAGSGQRSEPLAADPAAGAVTPDVPPPASAKSEADPRRPAPRATPGRRARSAPAPAPVSLDEFIALPQAAALPALESGRVVRIDVPVATLATLGFEVIPDPTNTEITADVLVGQDGQPRAIRFVNTEETSRRER